MTMSDEAYMLAETLLAEPLPRRWNHTQGVGRAAETLAPILDDDADLLRAAALLHDIGYSPELAKTGFHPLDGARYLREHGLDERIVQLVAHHSCALLEAEERGLRPDLEEEFLLPAEELREALIYCDMTTTPDGEPTTAVDRIAEIISRYGPDTIVGRFIQRAAPEIHTAAEKVTLRLAEAAS